MCVENSAELNVAKFVDDVKDYFSVIYKWKPSKTSLLLFFVWVKREINILLCYVLLLHIFSPFCSFNVELISNNLAKRRGMYLRSYSADWLERKKKHKICLIWMRNGILEMTFALLIIRYDTFQMKKRLLCLNYIIYKPAIFIYVKINLHFIGITRSFFKLIYFAINFSKTRDREW